MSLVKELSPDEQRLVEAAAEKAFLLYEGKVVAHRSCGIALAETFNLPSRPYQSLRKGGITGEGECGAIKAGELLLGEILGDPDPAGAVTPALRNAITTYQQRIVERVEKGESPDYRCNNLTAPLGDFTGPKRVAFCTNLASLVARTAAEVLLENGVTFEITAITPGTPPGGSIETR